MAILRSLVQEAASLAAIQFTESVDAIVQAVTASIPDDFCFPAVSMPESIQYVPCREGRSLYSIVKRRSFKKKSSAGRLSGVNGGKNVIFNDD